MNSTADLIGIRRLEPADLADYKALRDAMLAAHPESFTSDAAAEWPRSAESYRSRLGLDRADGGEFTLGAWCDRALVGAITCERDGRLKVRHIGHLTGMMVSANARGLGIGRALVDACIAEARCAQGLQLLTLSVTAGNDAAIALYQRVGFIRYGSLPNAVCIDGRYHAKDLMTLTL